jgi:hypothetical protein
VTENRDPFTPDCHAPVVVESDEYVCRSCLLRWDLREERPPCRRKSVPEPSDRETLEKVAKGYHDLIALQTQQRETTALMIRTCVARLKSPDSRKRREAIDGLEQLATMMEEKSR